MVAIIINYYYYYRRYYNCHYYYINIIDIRDPRVAWIPLQLYYYIFNWKSIIINNYELLKIYYNAQNRWTYFFNGRRESIDS